MTSMVIKCSGVKRNGDVCPYRLNCGRYKAVHSDRAYPDPPFKSVRVPGEKTEIISCDHQLEIGSIMHSSRIDAKVISITRPAPKRQTRNEDMVKASTPPALKPYFKTSFTIENDIPFPGSDEHKNARFPWASMKIDDSFWLGCHEDVLEGKNMPTPEELLQRMQNRTNAAGKRLGRSFKVRIAREKEDDPNSPEGVRVWRRKKRGEEEKPEGQDLEGQDA